MTSRYRAPSIFNHLNMHRAMALIPSTVPPPKTERVGDFKDRVFMSSYILPIISSIRGAWQMCPSPGVGGTHQAYSPMGVLRANEFVLTLNSLPKAVPCLSLRSHVCVTLPGSLGEDSAQKSKEALGTYLPHLFCALP